MISCYIPGRYNYQLRIHIGTRQMSLYLRDLRIFAIILKL